MYGWKRNQNDQLGFGNSDIIIFSPQEITSLSQIKVNHSKQQSINLLNGQQRITNYSREEQKKKFKQYYY